MFVKIIYISLHQKYPVVKKFLNLSTELYALNLFILISLDKNNLTEKINLYFKYSKWSRLIYKFNKNML